MSDISSDPGGRGLVVTIKYGKGYDEPWLVFRGLPHEVREDMESVFGADKGGSSNLPLSQYVLNCASEAVAMQTIVSTIGATAIGNGKSESAQPEQPQAEQSTSDDPPWDTSDSEAPAQDSWAQADEPQPEAKPNQGLYDTIDSINNVDDLKLLWADNQAAFTSDSGLLDHWKARGRALSA